MNYNYNTQTNQQFDSSYEAEKKWGIYAPHFQSEMREKQTKRALPKSNYNQLVILGYHLLKNA